MWKASREGRWCNVWVQKKWSYYCTTAQSTAEAELILLSYATREGPWPWKQSLETQTLPAESGITISVDIEGCIVPCKNDGLREREKHIGVVFKLVKHDVRNRITNGKYIFSGKNVTGIFAMLFDSASQDYTRKLLGLTNFDWNSFRARLLEVKLLQLFCN